MKAEIALEGLTFYAYHGFYEEERRAGNRFLVDIKVCYSLDESKDSDEISNTIDYGQLYKIVREEMVHPSKLLENVARNIVRKVREKFICESGEVSISKLAPPIGGACEKARVTVRFGE